jgi:hypothetical protein
VVATHSSNEGPVILGLLLKREQNKKDMFESVGRREEKRRLVAAVYRLNGDIESWSLLPDSAVFRCYSSLCSQIWEEDSSTSNKNLESTYEVGESRKISKA